MVTQLTLSLSLREDATFNNFCVGENGQLLEALKSAASGQSSEFIYLWGTSGCGKSHLLQAVCHKALEQQFKAAYIPLSLKADFEPDIFESLEYFQLIALDDVGAVHDSRLWQEALFHFYNRARGTQAVIIFSGHCPPQELALSLPDLTSRLSWGLTFQCHLLTDDDKLKVLQSKALGQGLELSTEVGLFLLRRCSRELPQLFTLLKTLDRASLSAQRKLTIPFVKLVLRI